MESLQKYVIDHHQKTIAECSNEELPLWFVPTSP